MTTNSILEIEEINSKYEGIEVSLDHTSSFKVKKDDKGKTKKSDVPLRRFNFINKKIKEFLLRESPDNIKLMDFGDGLGEVYAYKWKNSGGWVSFYAKFSGDGNIEIPESSTVSSGCFIFADQGTITLNNSPLVDTQIWAKGSVTLNNSPLSNCYIFGSVTLNNTPISERSRFFTSSCNFDNCSVSGHNLFYQDDVDLGGTMSLTNCSISDSVEISGNVTADTTNFSGMTKVSGTVNLKQCSLKDSSYVHSGKYGSINLEQCQHSEFSTVIDSVTAIQTKFKDNCFIGNFAKLNLTEVEGHSIVKGHASLTNCKVKGNVLINMNSTGTDTTYSDFAVQTGTTTKISGSISGNGILSGEGTSHEGSLEGRVFGGVACVHSVGEGERHWDLRSCLTKKERKFTLIDEREGGITPGHEDCYKEQTDEPTTC